MTDIEIAKEAKKEKITEVAKKLGLHYTYNNVKIVE